MLLSAFSPTIYLLYITYGLLTGLGFGFMYLTSIVAVQHWFNKRRALASGRITWHYITWHYMKAMVAVQHWFKWHYITWHYTILYYMTSIVSVQHWFNKRRALASGRITWHYITWQPWQYMTGFQFMIQYYMIPMIGVSYILQSIHGGLNSLPLILAKAF